MLKTKMHKKILTFLIPITLFVGSCRSQKLEEARNFGNLGDSLATLNKEVSSDIYGSCARAAMWEAQGTSTSRENMQKQLKICDEIYRSNAENTELAGSILVNYVKAVGNLAQERENGFNPELEEIGKALGELKFTTDNPDGSNTEVIRQLNPEAIQAGQRVADFISRLIVRDFRVENIKLAVVCTDKDLQIYASNLSQYIRDNYIDFLLNKEIEQINENLGFYSIGKNNLLDQLEGTGNNSLYNTIQESQMAVEAQERGEVELVVARKTVGANYARLIDDTANFHRKLKLIFNNDQENLLPEQEQECNEYRSENQKLSFNSIDNQTSSWSTEIGASELKQVREATKEYLDKINPILKELQK